MLALREGERKQEGREDREGGAENSRVSIWPWKNGWYRENPWKEQVEPSGTFSTGWGTVDTRGTVPRW